MPTNKQNKKTHTVPSHDPRWWAGRTTKVKTVTPENLRVFVSFIFLLIGSWTLKTFKDTYHTMMTTLQ